MKKTYILYFFVALLMTFLASSCLVEPKFAKEPVISFNKLLYDSVPDPDSIVVVFNFQDGDGDIGLSAEEEPGIINHFQELYIKNAEGQFDKYLSPDGLEPFNGRLPILNLDGRAKPIKGTIKYSREISPGFKGVISGKTIKFKIKVVDRAGNESNGGQWMETDSLVIPPL